MNQENKLKSDQNGMNVVERKRRRLTGIVVGDKADKTIRVRIERLVRHSLFEKIIRRHHVVQAHDSDNSCRTGDWVILEESPRFSKTKSWKVIETKNKQSGESKT